MFNLVGRLDTICAKSPKSAMLSLVCLVFANCDKTIKSSMMNLQRGGYLWIVVDSGGYCWIVVDRAGSWWIVVDSG